MNQVAYEVPTWAAMLDELEAAATRVLDEVPWSTPDGLGPLPGHAVAWSPPTGLGPLPEQLRPRAAAVLAALDAARDDLGGVATGLLEELDALGGSAAPGMGPTFSRRRRTTTTDAPPSPRLVDHDA